MAEKRFDLAYNALGQQNLLTRYADVAGTEMVATTTYAYDLAHRLTSLAHAQGVTDLAGYDYTYDAASRITSIDSFLDGLTSYTHDDSGQLTDADHTGQADEDYTYDDNGNRVTAGHTVGDNNQLLSDGTYDYEYDDEGNRTAKETIATGERIEYTWDHRNRLVTVTFKDALGVVTKVVDQAYDVNNQWIRGTLDSNGATSGGVSERFFVYDGTQIAMEFDGSAAGDVSHRYLWGPAVDQLLADEQVSSVSSAGSVVWPLADHLGTVRDLATYNAGTDTTTVANHRRYDSFGNVVSETNSAVDLLFGFTGRAYDEASGLQNNWNRWYDAVTGQWLSEDPIGFSAGDANIRRYVGNTVLNRTDPTGLFGASIAVQIYLSVIEGLEEDIRKHLLSSKTGQDLITDAERGCGGKVNIRVTLSSHPAGTHFDPNKLPDGSYNIIVDMSAEDLLGLNNNDKVKFGAQMAAFELINTSQAEKLSAIEKAAASGTLSRAEYIKKIESIEFVNAKKLIVSYYTVPKGSWGSICLLKNLEGKTFEQYLNDPATSGHKERYGQYWDEHYKTSWEKKNK